MKRPTGGDSSKEENQFPTAIISFNSAAYHIFKGLLLNSLQILISGTSGSLGSVPHRSPCLLHRCVVSLGVRRDFPPPAAAADSELLALLRTPPLMHPKL